MKTHWQFCLLLWSLFSLYSAATVLAHDGWIEVPALVEKGQPVTIALMLGNHANEHKSYRLAGKWNPKYTKLIVIEPSGKVNDITASLIDLGEDEEKTGPEGTERISHRNVYTQKGRRTPRDRAPRRGGATRRRSQNFAVSEAPARRFAALHNPRVAEGKKTNGFGRTFAIDNVMEIVPISNPLGVTQNDPVTLELRYKGNPFASKP